MGKWECKIKAEQYYIIIKEELGKEPNFADLINYRIIATSEKEVKEDFEFYRLGWSMIGKDVSNAEVVFNEAFNFIPTYLPSREDVINENDSILENAQDPNFKIFNPNFEEELYNNSIVSKEEKDDSQNIVNPKQRIGIFEYALRCFKKTINFKTKYK